jgi:hypothetical protein
VAAVQAGERTASAPVHLRTISAAEEAGGSEHAHLPPAASQCSSCCKCHAALEAKLVAVTCMQPMLDGVCLCIRAFSHAVRSSHAGGADPFVHLQLPQPPQRGSHQRSISTGSAFHDTDSASWPTGAHSRRSLSVAEGQLPPPSRSPARRRLQERPLPAALPEDSTSASGVDAPAAQLICAQSSAAARTQAAVSPAMPQLSDAHQQESRLNSSQQGAVRQLEPALEAVSAHQRHRDSLEQRQQQQPSDQVLSPRQPASQPQPGSQADSAAPNQHSLPPKTFTG